MKLLFNCRNNLAPNFIVSHGLFDIFVVLLTSLLLSFSDLSFLDATRLIDNFTGTHNRFSTRTFFQIKNEGYEGNDEPSKIFALVDVSDLTTRDRIAAVIDTVYSFSPQRIAIDLMFQIPQDSIADRVLTNTVANVRDKAIFACMLSDYQKSSCSFKKIKHSFFLDAQYKDWYIDSISEGYANLKNDGTNETVWLYSLVEKCGYQRVYSLPAMLLGDYSDESPHTEHIINYDKLNIPVYSSDSLTREMIEDKLVIIGAFKNSGDRYDTPLGLLPGMMIHTFIMQSEQTDAIIEQSAAGNIMLTCIVLLLFVSILVFVDVLAKKITIPWISIVLQGGFPTVFITIISVYLFMRYNYYLFADEGIFSDGHATLNGILIAAAVVKTIYSTIISILYHYGKSKWLTSHSIYGQNQ